MTTKYEYQVVITKSMTTKVFGVSPAVPFLDVYGA